MKVRKWFSQIEEIVAEQGVTLPRPCHRVITAAVVENPWAGLSQRDLSPLYGTGHELGVELTLLAKRVLAGAGASAAVDAYGKGAIVGLDGEVEHAAALLHPLFGKAVRAHLEPASAIMPSTAKRAAPGTLLDVPLHHLQDPWSFDHFDTLSVLVPDAPLPDEILVVLAVAAGGRPLARVKPVQSGTVAR